MDLADVMAPAIALARDGFVPDWYHALTMAVHAEELAAFPETARTHLRSGHYIHRPPTLADGDRIQQPDLARSLALLAKEGPRAFYAGALGQAMCAEMAAHGGFVTAADLAGYQVRTLAPLVGRYRGLEVHFSPGATGGPTALQILNILSAFPSEQVGCDSARGLHLRAEAVRYGFQDRLTWLGDPECVEAPWSVLASAEYGGAVAACLRPRGPRSAKPAPNPWLVQTNEPRASPTGPVGQCRRRLHDAHRRCGPPPESGVAHPYRRVPVRIARRRAGHRNPPLERDALVRPGAGETQLDRPREARAGEHGPRAGVPARRTVSSRLGAPGGRKIISAIPQVLSNLADLRLSPQSAIEAPRVHTEGGDLWVDDRVGAKALAALAKMGHPVVPKREDFSTLFFSRPVAIRVTREGLEAGLDALRAAAAAGH